MTISNCIPLILKYFHQDIHPHIYNNSDLLKYVFPNFPPFTTKESEELDEQSLQEVWQNNTLSSGLYNWRNLFTCINLLRILNMLVKGKQSRAMMLLLFGSAPILKKALKVREITLQYYLLKALKLQMRYLGRQWRKNNMKIVSAVYRCLRHHLNDDWAYGNCTDFKPWHFHAQDESLKQAIDAFNLDRYGHLLPVGNNQIYNECHNNENAVTNKNLNSNFNNPNNNIDGNVHTNYNNQLQHKRNIRFNEPALNNINDITKDCKNIPNYHQNLDQTQFTTHPDLIEDSDEYDNLHTDKKSDVFSILNDDIPLSLDFKRNYESWIDNNVFNNAPNWDLLLLE